MRLPRDETTGQLDAYAWPGGYPIFYITRDGGDVLCPSCANKERKDEQSDLLADINYEDSSLFCDECSQRIESAYAEDDAA